MVLLRWFERARRRWVGALDPDELDGVATALAEQASNATTGLGPSFAALRSVDGLFDIWLRAFRRDLRIALAPRTRTAQLRALRMAAAEYLRRSNDGWRVLEDHRLAEPERTLVLQLRRAPAFAQALRELGGKSEPIPLMPGNGTRSADGTATTRAGAEASTAIARRYNELVLSGFLGYLSVVVLDGMVKAHFNESLINEDARRSMEVADLQHLVLFKRSGRANTNVCTDSGLGVIEHYVATCLGSVVHALETTAVQERAASPGNWEPLRLEAHEWQQVFLQRPGRRLGDVTDRVAALLWAEIEQLLVASGQNQAPGDHVPAMADVVCCDICATLFAAYAAGIEVKIVGDCRAILSALAIMASSRSMFDPAGGGAAEVHWPRGDVGGQRLLALQIWLVDFEADSVARTNSVAEFARRLSGVALLSYLEPIERITLFVLIEYCIFHCLIPIGNVVLPGAGLPNNWAASHAAFVRREKRLLHALAVVIGSP
jgi:hypothetical protein